MDRTLIKNYPTLIESGPRVHNVTLTYLRPGEERSLSWAEAGAALVWVLQQREEQLWARDGAPLQAAGRDLVQTLYRREAQLAPIRAPAVMAEPSRLDPVSYQRAPTLMAGVTAGAQGAVRVWAPDKRLILGFLCRCLAQFGLAAGGIVYLTQWKLGGAAAVAFLPKAALALLIPAVRTLFRPCYVTTDDAGIGITTWRGSRALRWQEVGACTILDSRLDLHTMAGACVSINLLGYPWESRRELESVIRLTSEMKSCEVWRKVPGAKSAGYYIRRGVCLVDERKGWRPRLVLTEIRSLMKGPGSPEAHT